MVNLINPNKYSNKYSNKSVKGQLRGQLGIEYILLVSISIVMFIAIVFIANDQITALSRQQGLNNAKTALKSIADAANAVYAEGAGAKRVMTIVFPQGVEDSSPMIINNTLTLKYLGTDISFKLDFPISGTLPQAAGSYDIEIISQGGSVSVGVAPFTVSPSSLLFEFCSLNTSQVQAKALTFTNYQNNSLNISLSLNFNVTGVNVSVSSNSLNLSATPSNGSVKEITVTASVSPNVLGTYSGVIYASTVNYSTTVLITITASACGGGGGPTTNVSYILIKTYKDSAYAVEKSAFDLPPNVTITTGNWSANVSLTLNILDPTNTSVSGYPKIVAANSTGGYSEITPIIGTVGNYTIIVNDPYVNLTKTIQVNPC